MDGRGVESDASAIVEVVVVDVEVDVDFDVVVEVVGFVVVDVEEGIVDFTVTVEAIVLREKIGGDDVVIPLAKLLIILVLVTTRANATRTINIAAPAMKFFF